MKRRRFCEGCGEYTEQQKLWKMLQDDGWWETWLCVVCGNTEERKV